MNLRVHNSPTLPIPSRSSFTSMEADGRLEITIPPVILAYFLDQGFGVVSIQYRYACHGYSAFDMYDDIQDGVDFVELNADTWGLNASRSFRWWKCRRASHMVSLQVESFLIKSVFNLCVSDRFFVGRSAMIRHMPATVIRTHERIVHRVCMPSLHCTKSQSTHP